MRGWIPASAISLIVGVAIGIALMSVVLDDDESPAGYGDFPFIRGEGVARTTPSSGEVVDLPAILRTAIADSEIPVVVVGKTVEAESAERDDSSDLPGTFLATQGRGHFDGGVNELLSPTFCEGVVWSGIPEPLALTTPLPVTPVSPGAPDAYIPGSIAAAPDLCYTSNPPSSGKHFGVQRNVDLGGGVIINIPPDPDVYPNEVVIPRGAIPHILEHAGVFIGYHCVQADIACEDTVQQLEDVAWQLINEGDRVVMARDPDLPEGEIAFAAWTRVLNLPYTDYTEAAAIDFITTHSCRFDPEGFC